MVKGTTISLLLYGGHFFGEIRSAFVYLSPIVPCKFDARLRNRCSHVQRAFNSACRAQVDERKDAVENVLGCVYGWSGYSRIGGDGYCTTSEEDCFIEQVSGSLAYEYGEITTDGMRNLSSAVSLCSSDCFFDLGSGVGRCVLQAHLEWNVRLATGIELARSRHLRAEKALKALESLILPEPIASDSERGKVLFLHADILDADLTGATVIWCAALLFSEEFMSKLAEKLIGCRQLRAVATLQPFPNGLKGFTCGTSSHPSHDHHSSDAPDAAGRSPTRAASGSGPGAGSAAAQEMEVEVSWAQGRGTRAFLYTRSP